MKKLMIASDIHGSAYYCRKMLEAFDIGDPRERDCMVREVLGPVPSLK